MIWDLIWKVENLFERFELREKMVATYNIKAFRCMHVPEYPMTTEYELL